MKLFFTLISQSFYGKIKIFNTKKNALDKILDSLYNNLQEMNRQIFKKLKQMDKNPHQQILIQDIEQLFLINCSLFEDLSNLQQNASKINLWLLKRLNVHKFSISSFSIDKKLIQKHKSIDIKNQIFSIIDRQIDRIQKIKSPNTNYQLHLVIQGYGKSHLYYSSYMRLIQQSLAAYRIQKNVENELRSKNLIQINQNLLQPNQNSVQIAIPKINVQLSAITCSNFHSIFGFLYTLGLQNQQLRNEMNRTQSIANNLQRNISESFNDYKWTACSQMEIKNFFDEVWKDQFNTFSELQKHYTKEVDIVKHVKQAKQRYLADKEKIMAYCQNSFDFLIDFINKKINKQTFQKRKFDISKQLGIKYICDNENHHNFENQNAQSSQYVKQLLRSLFNHYQSLIQYVITSNDLILKNSSVNQGNKQSLWKGIVIKKLYSTYKLKSYICMHLKKRKMDPNITLAEFYEQANKKILLTFTTIDNSNNKLQFMNKNTFPNMPVWAAILAATSLHFLYRQFQVRKQWISKKFSPSSIFTTVVDNFFQKKSSDNDVVTYSCGNFISSLPLQLLTNQSVRQKMFMLKQQDPQTKSSKFIYLALAFKSLCKKPDLNEMTLKKNYINGALCKIACYKFQNFKIKKYILTKAIYPCLSGIFKLVSCRNKCFDSRKFVSKFTNYQKGHENNTYQIQKSTYIKQKIKKIVNYCVTGKVFSLLTQSNDNLIMSLYKQNVIKCPIKIGTLNFNLIAQNNKKQTKLDMPSSETIETIDRSYQITKNFILDLNIARKPQRQVTVRIALFCQNKNLNKSHSNVKCKLSFLSHSEWNKNPQKQFIVEYSLWQQYFQHKQFQRVQNSQIIWDTAQNDEIFLKFYYPYSQTIKKKKIYIIESKLCFSIKGILDNFIQNMKLSNSPKSVQFDYIIHYTKINSQNQSIVAQNMNRIPIFSERLKHKNCIRFSTSFNNEYNKHKKPQFRYQLTNYIINRTYTVERARIIDNYSRQNIANRIVTLICVHCCSDLTLLAKMQKSLYKCFKCQKVYGKLQCVNPSQNDQNIQRSCNNSSYCLSCVSRYILQRKKNRVICLLCTTIRVNQQPIIQQQQPLNELIAQRENSLVQSQVQEQVQNMSQDNRNVQPIHLVESEFKIKLPTGQQPLEDECYFCYQPYSVTMLFQCDKCKIKICTKCMGEHC